VFKVVVVASLPTTPDVSTTTFVCFYIFSTSNRFYSYHLFKYLLDCNGYIDVVFNVDLVSANLISALANEFNVYMAAILAFGLLIHRAYF
jgi:hypothetical protein